MRGIDVSSHNGDINFRKVKQGGYEFVFIKATEGVKFVDSKFDRNYKKAKKAGLKIGAYHFFRFDRDGVDQAINLLETIGNREFELGIAIDVEDHGNPKGIAPEVVKERLMAMAEYLYLKGRRVTFYTNRKGYESYLLDTFAGHPLWICSFSETPIDAEWQYWQYSHRGEVDGVDGDCDLNAFFGSREDWAQIGKEE